MSDENKQENAAYNRWAVSYDFQRFLLMILGSFVGCLIALCLYYASVGTPVRCSCSSVPRYDMYYGGGEYRPDCPYKKHKMKPYKPEKQNPAEKAPKSEK